MCLCEWMLAFTCVPLCAFLDMHACVFVCVYESTHSDACVCACVCVSEGLDIRRNNCVFNLLISRWWRIILRWSKSKSQFYQDLYLSIKYRSHKYTRTHTHTKKAVSVPPCVCCLCHLLKWMCLLYIWSLCHAIHICLCPSISTSQLSSVCVRGCVCVREIHTHPCEAHRELCSFGCGCMMDIWKLNWLMAPPSQQPAGCLLAQLREVCVCVCVWWWVVGGVGMQGGEWASAVWGALHLASRLVTDKHPCWTFKAFCLPNDYFFALSSEYTAN